MFFRKQKNQVALVEGRKTIVVAIYNVISSILTDMLKSDYSDGELKEAAANITNRITHRNETRPDPRNLKNISTIDRIKEAEKLGGNYS